MEHDVKESTVPACFENAKFCIAYLGEAPAAFIVEGWSAVVANLKEQADYDWGQEWDDDEWTIDDSNEPFWWNEGLGETVTVNIVRITEPPEPAVPPASEVRGLDDAVHDPPPLTAEQVAFFKSTEPVETSGYSRVPREPASPEPGEGELHDEREWPDADGVWLHRDRIWLATDHGHGGMCIIAAHCAGWVHHMSINAKRAGLVGGWRRVSLPSGGVNNDLKAENERLTQQVLQEHADRNYWHDLASDLSKSSKALMEQIERLRAEKKELHEIGTNAMRKLADYDRDEQVASLTQQLASSQEEVERLKGTVQLLNEEVSNESEFHAYLTGELGRFKCLHENDEHFSTPPMMWPELIACIRARGIKDATVALESQLVEARQLLAEGQKYKEAWKKHGDWLVAWQFNRSNAPMTALEHWRLAAPSSTEADADRATSTTEGA